MGYNQTSKFCLYCQKMVLAQRKTPNHILHLLLSIFTSGLWLIVWILLIITKGSWRCCHCGNKVKHNSIPKKFRIKSA